MHKIHTDKTLTALLCMLPILLGFLFVHGPYLNFGTFFVPWQHDDFEAFWGFQSFDFWRARPISTNFAHLAGNFGEPTYYVLYVALWSAALVANTTNGRRCNVLPEPFLISTHRVVVR